MHPVEFIEHKRDGKEHSREDLERFLMGYVRGQVPDYQVAAWLMAVCWRGMSPQETADLTEVMALSGDTLDLSSLPHTVDKHSTGGVGDKTSIVLAPLLAAAGATVAKMSGRGLGHTGGTVDKLESIPGFQSELNDEAFLVQARTVGVVVSGQSRELAPADGLLYALRDATATVPCLPLIAGSIMSKKLASGAQSIVLDVKVGSGAFMKTPDDARELARAMVDIGRRAGRRVRAVLSSMMQPLGRAVGNALELREAVGCLQGEGPADLEDLCLTLAQQVLEASGLPAGRAELTAKLRNGAAFGKFESWIAAQGGDTSCLDRLELASGRQEVRAEQDGAVERLDALAVGRAVRLLGGGRQQKGDAIDRGVGVMLHAKVGDRVQQGEPLLTLYHREGRGLEEAVTVLTKAIRVVDGPAARPPLILETLA
ncbi:MAG TPA: thymidine phosphorylase [Trueperaceae bacterium]